MPEHAPEPAPHDPAALLPELRAYLAREPREIPPRFFYDERGSQLFERITRLPEYYLTRTERRLLADVAAGWVRDRRPRSLVEPGAGSAEKTRILLDALVAAGSGELFVPIDVSADFLEEAARRLRDEYPTLGIRPVVADLNRPLHMELELPRPALVAFLGSTIGNFEDDAAVDLLAGLRSLMRTGDAFLLGADLRKDAARIEAAYNDSEGVTAEFNRNMLRVLNRTFGANFDPSAFRHRAVYDDAAGRVEMQLVAERPQQVELPGVGTLHFASGEAIRTEISNKYDRPRLESILARAGLSVEEWSTDEDRLYALLLARPA